MLREPSNTTYELYIDGELITDKHASETARAINQYGDKKQYITLLPFESNNHKKEPKSYHNKKLRFAKSELEIKEDWNGRVMTKVKIYLTND